MNVAVCDAVRFEFIVSVAQYIGCMGMCVCVCVCVYVCDVYCTVYVNGTLIWFM